MGAASISTLARTTRWIARILGVAFILFVMTFVIGEGIDWSAVRPLEAVQLFALFAMMLGLAVCLFKEGLGIVITATAYVSFLVPHVAMSHQPMPALILAPVGMCMALYIVAWWLDKRAYAPHGA